jgi:hypothetical protein
MPYTTQCAQYAFLEPSNPETALYMLPLCGIGVPKNEMLEVLLVMKRLGGDAAKNIKELRFFGKFFTLKGQYYVFECSMNERPAKVRALPSVCPCHRQCSTRSSNKCL